MKKSFHDLRQEEANANFEAFQKVDPKILVEHSGEYALMRHREIISFHKDFESAVKIAEDVAPDHIFSIQQVGTANVNLGFYSYAKF